MYACVCLCVAIGGDSVSSLFRLTPSLACCGHMIPPPPAFRNMSLNLLFPAFLTHTTKNPDNIVLYEITSVTHLRALLCVISVTDINMYMYIPVLISKSDNPID